MHLGWLKHTYGVHIFYAIRNCLLTRVFKWPLMRLSIVANLAQGVAEEDQNIQESDKPVADSDNNVAPLLQTDAADKGANDFVEAQKLEHGHTREVRSIRW